MSFMFSLVDRTQLREKKITALEDISIKSSKAIKQKEKRLEKKNPTEQYSRTFFSRTTIKGVTYT